MSTPPKTINVRPASEWKPGEQGFFKLDEQTYRSAPGLSQTELKYVLRSPACLVQSRKQPMIPTNSMILGTLVHAAIFEPETFGDGKSHYEEPEYYEADDKATKTKIKKPWNNNASFCKEWTETRCDLPILSASERDSIREAKSAFMSDQIARRFIEQGKSEIAVFATDPETGLMLKGKLDLFLPYKPTEETGDVSVILGDLKQVSDGNEREFAIKAAELGYHIQSAYYMNLVQLAAQATQPDLNLTLFNIRFFHCVLEAKRPHLVEWYEIEAQDIETGHLLWRSAVDSWHLANATDEFAIVKPLALPAWARK